MTNPYFIVRDTETHCFVHDTIRLDLKDATIQKEIVYKNSSESPIYISFKARKIIYPYLCQDFKCKIEGVLTKVLSKRVYYNQEIEILSDSITVEPNKEICIKIFCSWINFHSIINDFEYVINHPDPTRYRLTLLNYSLSNVPHIITINEKVASEGMEYHVLPNEIRFDNYDVSVGNPFFINILSLSTPKHLPVLSTVVTENKTQFAQFGLILIQHLLSDSIHLIETFHNFGIEKDGIFIVGIPYSTKHSTVKYLSISGYSNILAPLDYPFDKYVERALESLIAYCIDKSKMAIIVEDGGYAVPMLHRKYNQYLSLFKGAVEQTANGIWLDKDLIEKEKINLSFPVVNVAESKIKDELESPLIGKAVCKNVELMINKAYEEITGKKIGIIGLGRTGIEVVKQLIALRAEITVYDTRSDRIENAKLLGDLKVGDSVINTIANCDIAIEATGKLWTNDENEMRSILLSFKQGCYFFSGSSKRLGINHNVLKKIIEPSSTVNLPGFGKKYHLINGKELTLIADGFPVNFFLGESVPDKSIAFILAWLYKSAEIISNEYSSIRNEIIDTNDQDHDEWGFYSAQKEIRSIHEILISRGYLN